MKTISILFTAMVLLSCTAEQEPVLELKSTPGATQTEFVVEGQAFVTPNAYLLIDDAAGDYDREFSFVFTDATVIEDPATSGVAYEVTTMNFAKITCNLMATVPSAAQLPIFVWPNQNPGVNIIMEGNNYAHTNIGSFNVTNNVGGIEYGQVELSDSYEHTALPQGAIGNPADLFTVEDITVDLATGTGTIRCRYSFIDDNGIEISGTYVGSYEILTAL